MAKCRASAYGGSLSYTGGSLWAAIAFDQFNPSIGTTTSASSGSFKKATAALSYSLPWGRVMEHTIASPTDGVIREVLYEIGDQVAEGSRLLSLVLEEMSSVTGA